MHTRSLKNGKGIALLCRGVLLAVTAALVVGCGAVTVRHVPKVGSISGAKMADLRGSPPIELKSGAASSEETKIGTVGVGKVMGRMSEWTDATVRAISANLSARGATITAGAPKALTVSMTSAQVKARPIIGGANTRIALTATAPDGLNRTFEGSGSSMAPLGSVDEAVTDAVKKLLADTSVDAYLRKH